MWYFMYAKPIIAPSLGKPTNPLAVQEHKKGFQFLNIFNDTQESTSTTEVTLATPQALLQIWKQPATGQRFITEKILQEVLATSTHGTSTVVIKKVVEASSTILLFVDRTTGYVYGHQVETGKTYQISNTVVPGVYDAYIFNNGKRVLMRYLDTTKKIITTTVSTIPSVTPDDPALPLTETTFLPSNVTSVAVNKKGTLLSYLVVTDEGGSVYTLTQNNPLLVSTSPFREWLLSYGGNTLYATTKPSAYVEGSTVTLPTYAYIVGNKTGLLSIPNESGTLLSSMWSSSGLLTFLSSSSGQKVLPIKTLAKKCSWGTNGFLVCAVPKVLVRGTEGLPDDWLQGSVSFSDSLSVIREKDGTVYPLFSFEKEKITFDIISPEVSSMNDLISFNRKQNGSLWLLNTHFIESSSN